MRRSQRIRESEMRGLLRIAAQTSELPRNQEVRRNFIVESLLDLLGAPVGLIFEFGSHPRGGFCVEGTFQGVRLSDSQREIIEPYVYDGHPPDPTIPNVIGLPGEQVTVCRHHFVGDLDWYRSDHFQYIRQPADIDHQLYSRAKLADGTTLAIGIHRALGEPAFTLKECMLMDLFHEESARLYQCDDSDPRLKALPPRLKPVLKHFVEGDSEKQVAQKLGLSKHTVHEYAKVLYEKLGVSSRGELLAQFVGKV